LRKTTPLEPCLFRHKPDDSGARGGFTTTLNFEVTLFSLQMLVHVLNFVGYKLNEYNIAVLQTAEQP